MGKKNKQQQQAAAQKPVEETKKEEPEASPTQEKVEDVTSEAVDPGLGLENEIEE